MRRAIYAYIDLLVCVLAPREGGGFLCGVLGWLQRAHIWPVESDQIGERVPSEEHRNMSNGETKWRVCLNKRRKNGESLLPLLVAFFVPFLYLIEFNYLRPSVLYIWIRGLGLSPPGGWRFAWCGYRGQRSKYRVLKRTEKGSAISRNTVDCERKENKLILWPDLTRFVHKMCWKSEKALNTSQCRLQQLTGNKKFCSSTLLFHHKSPWTFVFFLHHIPEKTSHTSLLPSHIAALTLQDNLCTKKQKKNLRISGHNEGLWGVCWISAGLEMSAISLALWQT